MTTKENMAKKKRRRYAIVFAGLALVLAPQCNAQPAWKPDRAVEIVVGSTPGGSNDKVGRTMLRIWQENKWLENAVVVNKVGGGGSLAYAYTSQHPNDAHYVTVARTGLLSNHVLGLSPLNYTDMTPLAMVGEEAMSMAVRADSPIKSVKDLVARWKADPQSVSISIGSSRGSTTHFVLAGIAKIAGVDARKLKVITFGGAADSVTNLLGGHIDLVSLAVNNLIAHHKAGTMRVIGVASSKRLNMLPDVPTLKEQGFDVVVGGWTVILGPRGLTAPQIAYWEGLLERTTNHPNWKSFLEHDSLEGGYMKSQPTREFLRKDYESIRSVLTDLGMAK